MPDPYDPLEGMSPIDRLKLSLMASNKATVSPEQRAANLRQTGEDALSVLPVIGNAMAAKDAYKGAGEAYDAFGRGDYKQGGISGLLAALSGVGAVSGLPFGRAAGEAAKDASRTARIFAGPTAKTADHAALTKAQELAQSGASRDDIWRDTGWFQGADGKWRFEIDDSKSAVNHYNQTPGKAYDEWRQNAFVNGDDLSRSIADEIAPFKHQSTDEVAAASRAYYAKIMDALNKGDTDEAVKLSSANPYAAVTSAMSSRKYGPISAYFSHDGLYDAYPGTKQLHTRVDEYLGSNGAYFPESAQRGEQIAFKETPRTYGTGRSLALHELQHKVQNDEKFARGAMPSQFDASDLVAELRRARESGEIPFDQSMSAEDLAHSLYRRHAGEVEARNVQSRMDMTPEQRRAKAPWLTQDTPDEQQIVRFR